MSTEKMPVYGQYGQTGASEARDQPEFRRYWGILRRRAWLVITAFVIVVILGTVHAFKATPIYRADAKILIEKQTPRVMNFEDVTGLQVSDRDYYRTQQQLVESRAVLDKAIERPGVRDVLEGRGGGTPAGGLSSLLREIGRTVAAVMGAPPASPPELWERLGQVVEVKQLRETHLLQVGVESPNPRQAAMLANAVAWAFEQYHLARKLKTSNEAFKFLQEQGAEQEQKLEEAENSLQQFREEVKVVSLGAADRDNPLLVRLSRLNKQLTEAQLQRIELEAQFGAVKQSLESSPGGLEPSNEGLLSLPMVRSDQTLTELRTSLIHAEHQEAALAGTYGPGHPQLQVARLKAGLLRAEMEQALTELVESLSAQLEMLSRQEQALQKQYDGQNLLALEMARQSLTYSRLDNEVNRQRRLFEVLVERMREVDLSGDYAKTNVEVVEVAEVPKVPIRPRKARIVLLCIVVGGLLGVGLACFFEHLDDTVNTPEDMEDRVGIPVLGFVPAMESQDGEAGAFAYRGMVCAVDPACSATEAYRNIRTSLFFSAPAEENKTLVVASGAPGAGKTTTASNLALVMAQSGKRVLLVDADLRRPMVHRVFGLESTTGMTNVLVGEASLEEAVQKAHNDGAVIENLDILAAGPRPPNPAELLDSEAMRTLLQEARDRYERVLVDTPPVLFVTDASILGAMSDGVIMVVKSATNSRALARRAREQLEGVNARILGGVLNDVHVSRLGYYYSDYYHYGYSRYYKDYYGSYYADGKRED